MIMILYFLCGLLSAICYIIGGALELKGTGKFSNWIVKNSTIFTTFFMFVGGFLSFGFLIYGVRKKEKEG